MNAHPDATALPAMDFDGAAGPRRQLGWLEVISKSDVRDALPLTQVQVAARVADRVAEVSVRQTFVNNHDAPVEVIYIFPLSGGCSVSDFEMTSSGRTITGVLADREEARRNYQQALEKCESTALLEQERDDVFTVSVGNLAAGAEMTIRLVYSERLPFFEDGGTELRVPLVVAPRYTPGLPLEGGSVGDGTEPDTDQVRDASRITPPRLAPGFDPGTSLRLEVDLLGAVAELACSQHAVRQFLAAGSAKIQLSRTDELLDRDFVLRWRLANDELTPSLVYYRHDNGEVYGLLSVLAPRGSRTSEGQSRDVVFVLDRSGSMGGPKMTSAARACECLLRTLGPSDRFGIVACANRLEWFEKAATGPQLMVADEDGLGRGVRWLRGIEASGGTELAPALAASVDLMEQRPGGPARASVIVLITDGAVANERDVLEQAQRADRAIRLFTVGVDTAVNAGFLSRLARIGRGTSIQVEPGAALEGALISIGRDIGRPLVTDLTIEGADGTSLDQSTMAPPRISDLFGGRASSVSFHTRQPGPVRLRGTRPDGTAYEAFVDGRMLDLQAIEHVWARARVSDLEDQYRLQPERQDAIRKEIVATSIDHRVLSRFTAFLVVDHDQTQKHSQTRRKIVQPVHHPADWLAEAALLSVADGNMSFMPVNRASMPLERPYQGPARVDVLMLETLQLVGKALDMPAGHNTPTVENALHVLTERLHQMQRLAYEDVPWEHEALRMVTESLALLRRHQELCRRFEHLVSGLQPLVANGTAQWLDEAVTIVEELGAVLGQLRGLKDAFGQLEKGFQSSTQSVQTRRRPRGQRFWDVSV
jgi:Ca-activated chloride channel family protein